MVTLRLPGRIESDWCPGIRIERSTAWIPGRLMRIPPRLYRKTPTLLAPLSSGHKYTPFEIEADCIRDTIKAYYMAAVLFGDDARIDEASVVRSQSIYYEDTGEWKSQFENETVSELENRIYEACSRKYREWSKQLSCSDKG